MVRTSKSEMQQKMGKVLVTAAWPYLNSIPHLGTLVGSILSADVYARFCRLVGEEVVMVSGSDEHGTPIEVEAVRLGVQPKELTDRNHAKVVHKDFVKNHFARIYDNGYIAAKESEMLYCKHCGRFLPDRFVEGTCPSCGHEGARGDQCDNLSCGRLLEPTLLVEPYCVICKNKPIVKTTKHWYFDLSKFSEKLAEYLKSNKHMSNSTRNFSLSLIKEGLKPRAITRDVSKTVEWGIKAPFPNAENKTIYVWFEAVMGYVSATIEHFKNINKPEKWKEYWFDKNTKTLFFIGKDNIPFHTIIFPALLLASEESYNLPWNVSATEFLLFKKERFSKSHGIGIMIDEALELFPADYWRFFLMATRPEAKDTDFSWELFKEKINADLNDSFGNFIHRTLSFINTQFKGEIPSLQSLDEETQHVLDEVKRKTEAIAEDIEKCRIQAAANTIISISRIGNQYLNEKEPWNLLKKNKAEAEKVLYVAAQIVKALALMSAPFMPSIAEEIWKALNLHGNVHQQTWNEALKPLPQGHKIAKSKPLFQKIDDTEQQLDEKLERIREKLEKTA